MNTFTRNKKPLIAVIATAVLGLGLVGNADVLASTNSQNLGVTASVVNVCAVGGVTPVGFGTYDPIVNNATSPQPGTGTFTIKCNAKGSATLSLDNGKNSAYATGTTRAMVGTSSDYLNYDLYTSNAYTTVWNGTNTVAYGPATNGTAYTETVYGQIPSAATNTVNANAVPDSYSDTVVITATY